MPAKMLTKRRREMLNFIEKTTAERGYPPTVREIGEAVGLSSSSSVQFHIEVLKEAGYLERDERDGKKLTRALRVRSDDSLGRPSRAPVYVPLVGQVAAGEPILAEEHIEDHWPMPPELTAGPDSFMLRVQGDSMINAGILDGDFVLVAQQQTAENGDIVVALLEDEATVKRFYQTPRGIELRPENPSMAPIVTDDDVRIIGKVRAVVRQAP
ncbi:MAG: transcriptional repressor LexA [Armatimonadota bacterium]